MFRGNYTNAEQVDAFMGKLLQRICEKSVAVSVRDGVGTLMDRLTYSTLSTRLASTSTFASISGGAIQQSHTTLDSVLHADSELSALVVVRAVSRIDSYRDMYNF